MTRKWGFTCTVLATVFAFSLATTSRAEFLGIWTLDEGNGEKMTDISGSENHGTITNPTWINGRFGKAIFFADESFARVADPGGVFDTPDGVSVGTWVVISALPDCCSGVPRKMDSADAGGWVLHPSAEGAGWRPYIWMHAGNWIGTGADDDAGPHIIQWADSDPEAWEQDDWVHMAATYDGDEVRLYVNGELMGKKKGEVVEIDPGDGPLGWSHDVFDRRHQGAMDETWVADEAFPAAQIQDIMNMGMTEWLAVEGRGKLPVEWARMKTLY